MFILQSFLHLFKGAKRMDFIFTKKYPKMAKRVKRELFPCKKYQNPSQCDYKMLVVSQLVKIVWTDAAYLLKNSLFTFAHAPTNISNPHF